MKRKYVSIALLAALVLAASTASAQGVGEVRVRVNGNASVTPVEVKTRAETNAEVRAGAQSRQASSSEARTEMQTSVAKRKAANTERVFSATVDRLEKIADRIESRIAKFEDKGAPTTDAVKFLAEARAHLDLADTSISAFASLDLSGELLRDNFAKIRTAASEAKMHIREAHTSLMMSVRSLKASAEVEASATTTAE